jgi:hypothetical protein
LEPKTSRTRLDNDLDPLLADGPIGAPLSPPRRRHEALSPIIEPPDRLHVTACSGGACEIVTAKLADFHRLPAWVINQENVSNRRSAEVAASYRLLQIGGANTFPTEIGPYLAMLPSMAAAAEGFTVGEFVLPRHFAWNVPLVMDLKSYPVGRSSPTIHTPAAIELDYLGPKRKPRLS